MSQETSDSLAQQRASLQRKMIAQRLVIAHRLGPVNPQQTGYPRSMTMQLLIRRPDIGLRLLAPLTGVLLGSRFLKSIPLFLLLASILRSVATNRMNERKDIRRANIFRNHKHNENHQNQT